MGIFTTIKKDIFPDNEIDVENYDDENEETVVKNVAVSQNKAANKIVCVEPRAYSESQQIADHLKRRNSVVTGSGKNRRRFRESVSTRDSCAGTGRADRGDALQTACGIPERGPECSGSDKRCRISHYRSKKRIILTAERI